jgi:hypothetical protein
MQPDCRQPQRGLAWVLPDHFVSGSMRSIHTLPAAPLCRASVCSTHETSESQNGDHTGG